MTVVPVITIDGPTASGKGTIAQRVADALQFQYLDSGALYRLVAWCALRDGVGSEDADCLRELAASLEPRFVGGRIFIGSEDVTDAIRAEEVSRLASRIAVHPGVRQALLELQHSRRRPPGLVADGRDMGTIVFPDARLKIYLTASLPARTSRRYKQLIEKGFSTTIATLSQEQVDQEIRARDQRDSERTTAPLRPAKDARLIDSSELTADEVVALVLKWSHERLQQK